MTKNEYKIRGNGHQQNKWYMKFRFIILTIYCFLVGFSPTSFAQTPPPNCAGLTTELCSTLLELHRQRQEQWNQMQRDMKVSAAKRAAEQAENDHQRQAFAWQWQEKQQREIELACKKKGITDQYWQECILDRIPGARNEVAVAEGKKYCDRTAPCTRPKIKRGWIFGVTTAHECFEKYGKRTSLKSSAYYIRTACYGLYEDK